MNKGRERVVSSQGSLYQEIRDHFDKKIVGQERVKDVVSQMITNIHQDVLPKKSGPLSVLFFKGPTGSGKTEMIKQIADVLIGYELAFTKISCDKLTQSHDGSVIFGSPPGYVGYGKPTPLSNENLHDPWFTMIDDEDMHKIAKQKHQLSIIAFDEIEKAHPKIRQSLLAMMEDDYVSLSDGSRSFIGNSIIIFTSNIGESAAGNAAGLVGFGGQGDAMESKKNDIKNKHFEQHFSPEFRGRLDYVLDFEAFNQNHMAKKIEKLQSDLMTNLIMGTEGKVHIQYDPSVVGYISSLVDLKGGARQIEKVWDREVVKSIGSIVKIEELLYEEVPHLIKVKAAGNKLAFSVSEYDSLGKDMFTQQTNIEAPEENKQHSGHLPTIPSNEDAIMNLMDIMRAGSKKK